MDLGHAWWIDCSGHNSRDTQQLAGHELCDALAVLNLRFKVIECIGRTNKRQVQKLRGNPGLFVN